MTIDNKQHAAMPVRALLGRKLDMTQVWDADGRLMPLTVVQAGINVVIQARTEGVDGYSAVQLGFGETPARKITEPMAGHFTKAGVESRRHLAEFHTSTADNYELDQELQATVFEAGQTVDISGNTKGKGFTGVMKRYNLTDVSANHGAHRNHRKPGSIGTCATPGRIFKGLRMADRMGNVHRTVQNLKIQTVDTEKDLLPISGAIPGPKNSVVLVHSSVKGA